MRYIYTDAFFVEGVYPRVKYGKNNNKFGYINTYNVNI